MILTITGCFSAAEGVSLPPCHVSSQHYMCPCLFVQCLFSTGCLPVSLGSGCPPQETGITLVFNELLQHQVSPCLTWLCPCITLAASLACYPPCITGFYVVPSPPDVSLPPCHVFLKHQVSPLTPSPCSSMCLPASMSCVPATPCVSLPPCPVSLQHQVSPCLHVLCPCNTGCLPASLSCRPCPKAPLVM